MAKTTLEEARKALKDHPLVGIEAAAEYLGVHKPQVYRFIESGRMPPEDARVKAGPLWIRDALTPLKREIARDRKAREKRQAAAAASFAQGEPLRDH